VVFSLENVMCILHASVSVVLTAERVKLLSEFGLLLIDASNICRYILHGIIKNVDLFFYSLFQYFFSILTHTIEQNLP
jgi:hypothetical protein